MKNDFLIDFRELAGHVSGEALEQMARLIGLRIGMTVSWSGRGADRGKDLLFTDVLRGNLASDAVTWLVSCKDFAASGRSVTEDDLPHDLHGKLAQHDATGFLLVTTTTLSAGAKDFLDKNDRRAGGKLFIAVWDVAELTAILLRENMEGILKQFCPMSFRKVKQLNVSSVAEMLGAVRDLIPRPLYDFLATRLPYFEDKRLHGTTLSPTNADVARRIDSSIAALLLTDDYQSAAHQLLLLNGSILVSVLNALSLYHGSRTRKVALMMVGMTKRGDDASLNLAQFLFDEGELTNEEKLDVLLQLPDSDIVFRLTDDICDSLRDSEVLQTRLNSMGSYAQYSIDNVYLGASTASVEDDEDDARILLEGVMEVEVEVDHEPEDGHRIGSASTEGSFVAYFDADGVHIDSIGLDEESLLGTRYGNDPEDDDDFDITVCPGRQPGPS